MAPSLLSPFQQEVLRAFFAREPHFFLSGGAALAGYYLGHRATEDLDLFTDLDVLDDGDRALGAVAADIEAKLVRVKTSSDFRRRVLTRGDEGVIVDLIRDRAPQVLPKRTLGAVRVDAVEEILANKLCALLSRSEIRDLVDVYALEKAGHRVEEALPLAQRKDAGLTPAQLGWVLSQVKLDGMAEPDPAKAPGAPRRVQLQSFLEGLIRRLSPLAHPG